MTKIMVEAENILSFEEAAKILSYSRPHIYNLISKHNLTVVTIGDGRHLLKEEVEALRVKLGKEQAKGVTNGAGN